METSTLQWLMDGTNAHNMGRMGFAVSLDDKVAAQAIWEKVRVMLKDNDSKWEAFVKGWNNALDEFKHGIHAH